MKDENSRELFLSALSGGKTPRPPIWVMRQAGRYLPEYRALKEKYGFLGIVKTPEASVEAALQPIRRFGFDCAIVFSDILALSEALGYPYEFADGGGIFLPKAISSPRDIQTLPPADVVRDKLSYVADSIKMLRAELPERAVIGFSAAPWTLAAYMVEGGGSKNGFKNFSNFVKKFPEEFSALMDKISEAIAEYIKMQCECGIDAFQIFDSNASYTPEGKYWKLSGAYIEKVLNGVGKGTKSILYLGDFGGRFSEAADIESDAFSVGPSVRLSEIKKSFAKNAALQGNLDPKLLEESSPAEIVSKARDIMEDMKPCGGHIFNLGGGITPKARLENVEALVNAVKNFGE